MKVVETGSFAEAARRLRTSSGQASKLVARLEAELGVKLLHRTTRALSLTEAGQDYADRLRGLIEGFDELEAEMRQAAVVPRGRLRLTAPLSFGTLRLAPMLARFAVAWPEIALDVQFTDRFVDLVDEGFDAAVRVGTLSDATLTGRRLGRAEMVVLAAPAYLASRGEPVEPGELARHDCILDTNMRDPMHWGFAGGRRVAVTGRLSLSNASACLAAAEAGLGIAYVPDFVCAESLTQGRVRPILTGDLPPPMAIHLLWPSGRHVPPKLRALIDALVKEFRSEA